MHHADGVLWAVVVGVGGGGWGGVGGGGAGREACHLHTQPPTASYQFSLAKCSALQKSAAPAAG